MRLDPLHSHPRTRPRPARAGTRSLVVRAAIAAVATLLLVSPSVRDLVASPADEETASGAGARGTAGDGPRTITVGLVHGQAIVGTFVDETFTVRTRYGTLSVPFDEVVKMRVRPSLSPEEASLLENLLRHLEEAEEEEGPLVERAMAAVRALGVPAFAELRRARKGATDDYAERLDALIESITAREGVYLEDPALVITERFTMRGEILEDAFRLRTISGVLTIPRRDVVHVTFREIDIRKTWKITAQHAEQGGTVLDTTYKVRKNQKFSLTPSGTMTYDGQSYGPAGISNHTWNSRKVGCLQWRIGNGPWQLLGAPFEGKAEQKGTIQFCVHLFNSGAAGEFKVVFLTKAK